MSQMPPTAPPAFAPVLPQRRTDGVSVASLVTGILGFCIPLLSGLAAVILGLIGLRRTRNQQRGGRGFAIAGLILGVLSLGLWLLAGGGVYAFIKYTTPNRQLARQFIADLNSGNVAAATSKTAGTITTAELQNLISTAQKDGSFSDLTTSNIQISGNQCTLHGVVVFTRGVQSFTMDQVDTATGWKVTSLQLQ